MNLRKDTIKFLMDRIDKFYHGVQLKKGSL